MFSLANTKGPSKLETILYIVVRVDLECDVPDETKAAHIHTGHLIHTYLVAIEKI